MSNITDSQTEATYNAEGAAQAAAYLATTGDNVGAGAVIVPVTATGFQVSTKRNADLYITVNTAAALAIAISPDNVTYTTLAASASYALGVQTMFVPAGWYVKLTGTMANLTVTPVLR